MSVLFDSDFESTFAADGWPDPINGLISIVTPPFAALSGAKCMRFAFQTTDGSITSISDEKFYGPTTTLYGRFGYRLDPGWQVSTNGFTKIWILDGHSASTGGTGPPAWDGNQSGPRIVIEHLDLDYIITIESPYGNGGNNYTLHANVSPSTSSWDQVEFGILLNTPGQANGSALMWVNNVQKINATGLELVGPTHDTLNAFGSWTPSDWTYFATHLYLQSGQGNAYYDRMALGNTRIGVVGGGGGDTTPPTAPTNLVGFQLNQTTVRLQWVNGTDASGVTGVNIHRCTGGGCTPPGTNYATLGGVQTFDDTLLSLGTYGYQVNNFDAASNQGPFTPTVYVNVVDITPPPPPTNVRVV